MKAFRIPFFLFLCHGFPIMVGGQPDLYTIAVIPDPQFYDSFYPGLMEEQAFWACTCAHDPTMNVMFVAHLGDVVHRGNQYKHDWENARRAMHSIQACHVRGDTLPHGVLPGNHDIDESSPDPYQYYVETFPLAAYEGKRWFGASYSGVDMKSSYQLVSDPYASRDFLFVHIEYLRGDHLGLLQWVSALLDRYAERTAILVTHFAASDCVDALAPHMAELVVQHCNVMFLLGGHVFRCGGERAIAVRNQCNRTAWVLVSNYQARDRGGNGWLRYYTFYPHEDKVCAYTYSPSLRAFEHDENSFFSLDLGRDMALGPGCTPVHECSSHYAAPGFVLAAVWIASFSVFLIYFLMLVFPHLVVGVWV